MLSRKVRSLWSRSVSHSYGSFLGKSKPFTDENAAWLKMMEDGDGEEAADDEFPDDEAETLGDEFDLDDDEVSDAGSSGDDQDVDDDGEVLLNIEKKSRKLDAKKKKDAYVKLSIAQCIMLIQFPVNYPRLKCRQPSEMPSRLSCPAQTRSKPCHISHRSFLRFRSASARISMSSLASRYCHVTFILGVSLNDPPRN